MTLSAANLAKAAAELVGTPFRLHGRDARHGLDCIGVLSASLASCGAQAQLPNGYRMRMTAPDSLLPHPEQLGFVLATPPFHAGDVVMQRTGPAQYHIAIKVGGEHWVHAHAGLRRVVLSPSLGEQPIVHHWRVAPAA